jgi:hypothetical protein
MCSRVCREQCNGGPVVHSRISAKNKGERCFLCSVGRLESSQKRYSIPEVVYGLAASVVIGWSLPRLFLLVTSMSNILRSFLRQQLHKMLSEMKTSVFIRQDE